MAPKKPISRPIYLDNAAATPMDERVVEAMVACLKSDGIFGNAASKDHVYGWEAADAIDMAREDIADAIGCDSLDLIFTSGATEANNLAIMGLLKRCAEKGDARRHLVTTMIEHKSVLECFEELERQGYSVTYIKTHDDGSVSPELLQSALTPDTILVSIAHANSVLGTVNDLSALSEVAFNNKTYFHSDLAQSNGLLDIKLSQTKVSLATLTPEKIYGPKGVGALYIRREGESIELKPLILGGGHEKGLRGGTLATHQIAAMGMAFKLMKKERKEVTAKVLALRERLIAGLQEIPKAIINGSQTSHLPGIVSVSFKDTEGKYLIPSLRGLACSTGSACSSKELKPSYVLSAIGYDDELARASLRLSIGRFNTEEDIDNALNIIKNTVSALKKA